MRKAARQSQRLVGQKKAKPTSSRNTQSDHKLDSFDSGQPALDEWLRRSALHAESIRSGRTWVWTETGGVVAYFTLVGHVVEREMLPRQLGRGSQERIPAVVIARPALDRAHTTGKGWAACSSPSVWLSPLTHGRFRHAATHFRTRHSRDRQRLE